MQSSSTGTRKNRTTFDGPYVEYDISKNWNRIGSRPQCHSINVTRAALNRCAEAIVAWGTWLKSIFHYFIHLKHCLATPNRFFLTPALNLEKIMYWRAAQKANWECNHPAPSHAFIIRSVLHYDRNRCLSFVFMHQLPLSIFQFFRVLSLWSGQKFQNIGWRCARYQAHGRIASEKLRCRCCWDPWSEGPIAFDHER